MDGLMVVIKSDWKIEENLNDDLKLVSDKDSKVKK